MPRLDEALRHRAERGTPVGADRLIQRLSTEIESAETPELSTPRTPWAGRPLRWKAAAAFVAAMALVLVVIGLAGLLREDASEMADTPDVTIVEPTLPESPAETIPPSTESPSEPTLVPDLGHGWKVLLSAEPGDNLVLNPDEVDATVLGWYVSYVVDSDLTNLRYRLMTLDNGAPVLIDTNSPVGGGFVSGGPGVVAWGTRGPEANLQAEIWVSSDGIRFEQAAEGLLIGCDPNPRCHGSEMLAAAGSPEGRVVALAYDGLVLNPDTGNYDVTPVAVVSGDGSTWTRHPIDLVSVLPEDWEGSASLQSPLVHVAGRWITYATHYYNSGQSTHTALLASADGETWETIDTGTLFDDTYLLGMAAGEKGVLAVSGDTAFWSANGTTWTKTVISDGFMPWSPAANDDGFVAVGTGIPTDESTLLYSPDGVDWTSMTISLDQPAFWNGVVGNGSELMAFGVTAENVQAIWLWEP